MRVLNRKVLNNKSMASSFSSDVQQLDHIYGFSIQIVFTGTPSGAFKVQVSNDEVETEGQVTNWSDVAGSSTSISTAGDLTYNYDGIFSKWVKVVYTRVSGTGTANAQLYMKGI